jgi:hypothetical protein
MVITWCLGYLAYLFQNQEVNSHAGNLITICLMHGWRRKGTGRAIINARFGTDVSRSQYRYLLTHYFIIVYVVDR